MIFNLILRITARSETKFVLVSVFIWLYIWNKYRQIFVCSRNHTPPISYAISLEVLCLHDLVGKCRIELQLSS
nr:MAG TPA: hypothetical protein [Caudoviricetes sp.]